MRTASGRFVPGLGVWLALVLCTHAAFAQPAVDDNAQRARDLYGQARRAFQEERYRDAALGFEATSKLHPHAVALYTAAQAWELAGERARAADAYSRALETPGLSESQSARARERLADLTPELGVVVVTGDSTTRARLDEQMEMTLPARLHGISGLRTVTLLFADGQTDQRKLALTAGQSLELSAVTPAASPMPPRGIPLLEARKVGVPPEAEESRASPWVPVGWIATGAGVAALGGAVLLGLSANDAERTYEAAPSRATLDHARSLETSTNAMLVVGGILTAGGVGVLLWQAAQPDREASRLELRVSTTTLRVAGSF
jgi:hypothetical protein